MGTRVLRLLGMRVLMGLATLIVVSMIIFFSVGLLPGDYATEILGQSATPDIVSRFRHELGLDEPALQRYLAWLAGLFRGDLGRSYASHDGNARLVADIIGVRLANSFFLAGVTALVAVPLAVGLGILAARFRGSWLDRILNSTTLAAISCPEFFMAYLLMLLLSVHFNVFYSLATVGPGMDILARLQRIVLPVMTLTLIITAHMMRMTRTAVLDVLANPYIEMARCKGLSESRILLTHALPNAWAPIVNVVAFNLSYLVVGVVVVEVAFAYPGIGQTMIDAVRTRDVPVIQACALIFAATYIVVNLLADAIAIATNPKLMYAR
ncbi:MAG TPA: ABC transporter permease [Bosea sp. (in: a-proteobacteria)]